MPLQHRADGDGGALRCTALYVLLPVFRSGKMNTVARPATGESGSLSVPPPDRSPRRTGSDPRAAGRARSRTRAVAARTFSTSAPDPEVPVEYDSIATRGSMPNCCAVSTEEIAMSANCSVVGSGITAQSP